MVEGSTFCLINAGLYYLGAIKFRGGMKRQFMDVHQLVMWEEELTKLEQAGPTSSE